MLLLLLVLLDLVSDLFAVNLNSIISSVTAVLVLVVNALCGLLGYWGFHLGWGYFKFHWKLLCDAWFNAWTLINALSDHASGSRLACWLDAASSGESFVKIWVFGRGKNLLTCHSLFGRRLNNRLFLGLSLNGRSLNNWFFLGLSLNGRSLNNWFFLLVLVLNGGTLLQNWFGVLKCILEFDDSGFHFLCLFLCLRALFVDFDNLCLVLIECLIVLISLIFLVTLSSLKSFG